MHATPEQIEAYKASNDFDKLAYNLWFGRAQILESKGRSVDPPEQFRSFLNKVIVKVLAGPDHPTAVNTRIAVALRGTTVHWELKDKKPSEGELNEARDFVSGAAEEFGVSVDDDKYRKLAKRYKPLFDEAYRRSPKKKS